MDYKWIIWLSLIVLNISRFFFLSERRKFYLNFSYKELWTFVINSEYRINFFSASNRSSNKLSRNLIFIESESCDKKFFLAKHFLVGKKKKRDKWEFIVLTRLDCTYLCTIERIWMENRSAIQISRLQIYHFSKFSKNSHVTREITIFLQYFCKRIKI